MKTPMRARARQHQVRLMRYATGTSRQRAKKGGSTAGHVDLLGSRQKASLLSPSMQIAQQVEVDQNSAGAARTTCKLLPPTLSAFCKRLALPNYQARPTGRLSAMRARVEAMLQAVQAVRPALDRFYQSLSDEQKERFTAVAQSNPSRQQPDLAGLCGGSTAQSRGLPIDRVERELRLIRIKMPHCRSSMRHQRRQPRL